MDIWRKYASWLITAACVVVCGCGSPSGGRLALFPEGYRLTPSAKAIRAATPPPADMPRELEKTVTGPYVVEPGDVLLVQPGSLDSPIRLPGDQPILPDGTIQLGRYGHIQVAGKTIEMIQIDVNALLSKEGKDIGPIVVRLVARDSKVFYVLGEVNAPGAFPLRGREAVLDAILAAGGMTSNAQKRGIILSRPTSPDSCRIVLPVRFNDIVQLGDTTTNYQIRAGDRVFIPSRNMWEDLCRLFHHNDEQCSTQIGCEPTAALGSPLLIKPVPGAPFVTPVAAPLIGPPKSMRPRDTLPQPVVEPYSAPKVHLEAPKLTPTPPPFSPPATTVVPG